MIQRAARATLTWWRARKPRTAVVAGERFLLRYPYSYFDPGNEQGVLDAFVECVGPTTRVYDIGANAGIFTLLASRRGASAVAFEPAAAAAALVRDHLELNGLAAEVVEAVIAETEGTVAFYEQGTATTSSLSEASARTGEAFLDVPVVRHEQRATTIDAFSARAGSWPDVVKLDVEGAELLALQGAARWLERRSGTLLLEVHPWSLAQLGGSPEGVFELLDRAGWRSELIEDNGNTSHHRVVPA